MWLMFTAFAVEPPTCPPADDLVSAERWLRAASLDIRGVVPAVDEYQQITSPDELPDALLETWLSSDAFITEAVRQHNGRLFNRFDDLRLTTNRSRMANRSGILNIRARNGRYRDDVNLDCGDFPAADADNDGAWDLNVDGQEGWVELHPYWLEDPAETVRVCAFEAQPQAVSPLTGVDCSTNAGTLDVGCGCGPELQWCLTSAVENDIEASFGEAMDVRIAEVIRSDRPYTDLFFEDRIYINGPLAHFFRHLTQVPGGIRIDEPPFDTELTPDLGFHESENWVWVPAPSAHAGMLTDPAFLLRFMTNRARVNRFYEDFLCQPLIAPTNGIDLDAPISLDLSARPGCAYCHAIMEPAGVYWGRFTESGAGFLDPDIYPAFDPVCFQCSIDSEPCPSDCRDRYTVDPGDDELDPYVGYMTPLQFRPEAEHGRIDEGPGALAAAQIANGQISECLTDKTAIWLLGAEAFDPDSPVLSDWNATLLASDWSYRELVKAIITSPTYRRVR